MTNSLEALEELERTVSLSFMREESMPGNLLKAVMNARLVSYRLQDSDTYTVPDAGWTCFHCGETFDRQNAARRHFGDTPTGLPRCRVLLEEITRLRDALEMIREETLCPDLFPDNETMTEGELAHRTALVIARAALKQPTPMSDKKAMVLYFSNDEDRDAVVAEVNALLHPRLRAVSL